MHQTLIIFSFSEMDVSKFSSADVELDFFSLVGGQKTFYEYCGATDISSSAVVTQSTKSVVSVSLL